MHRVVITGFGAISPFGRGRDIYFDGLRRGYSATRRVSLFLDPRIPCQVAAEIPEFSSENELGSVESKRVPRVVPVAIAAAREALADAGLQNGLLPCLGVLVGTGGGGIEFAEKQYETFFQGDSQKVTPYCVSSSFVGMLSSEISIALGLKGASHVISTGCTSSTDALGYAFRFIKSGQEERLLVGGAEACITRGILAGFSRMKVVPSGFNENAASASRPFERDREGFVLGEGAWMFVLESEESAQKRGAKIYAEIAGYGSTCEAYHRVAVNPDGVEPARAMQIALDEAGVDASRVQSIQLHGTATRMNDEVETKAVKLRFNGHAKKLAASAIKSMIGHSQGACGAAAVGAALLTLKQQFVPPTINYENPDPNCDLDYTPNRGVDKEVENLLCNTIAFGSKNSALLLKRWI